MLGVKLRTYVLFLVTALLVMILASGSQGGAPDDSECDHRYVSKNRNVMLQFLVTGTTHKFAKMRGPTLESIAAAERHAENLNASRACLKPATPPPGPITYCFGPFPPDDCVPVPPIGLPCGPHGIWDGEQCVFPPWPRPDPPTCRNGGSCD